MLFIYLLEGSVWYDMAPGVSGVPEIVRERLIPKAIEPIKESKAGIQPDKTGTSQLHRKEEEYNQFSHPQAPLDWKCWHVILGARGLVPAFCYLSPLGRIAVIRMAPVFMVEKPRILKSCRIRTRAHRRLLLAIHYCQTIVLLLTNAAVTDSRDVDYRDLTLSL